MLLYEHIDSNKKKTVLLMICFFIVLNILGTIIGFLFFEDLLSGLVTSSIITIIYMFITVSSAESIVLRMNNARPISKEDNIFLYN
ncbi:MAG: hypothetical protein IJH34_06415, partial [Romboutsia sp.]|nr:hypothetical protein [Romboutsia sp.]